LLFPAKLKNPFIPRFFDDLLLDVPDGSGFDRARLFRAFRTYVSDADLPQLQFIVQHSAFPRIAEDFPQNPRDKRGLPFLKEFLERLTEFKHDETVFNALCTIFRAGFLPAQDLPYQRLYQGLLEMIRDRVPQNVIVLVTNFVVEVFERSTRARFPYAFNLFRTIIPRLQGFQFPFEKIIGAVIEAGDINTAEPFCGFFTALCEFEPSLRGDVLRRVRSALRTEIGFWPRAVFIALCVRMLVPGPAADVDAFVDLFAEVPALQNEETAGKLFAELKTVALRRIFFARAVVVCNFGLGFEKIPRWAEFFVEVKGEADEDFAKELLAQVLAKGPSRKQQTWMTIANLIGIAEGKREELLALLPRRENAVDCDQKLAKAIWGDN
jgi:hypothetical protein